METMKLLVVLLLFGCAGFAGPRTTLAQSAFDSACYYPTVGYPNEIDTIYGAVNNQALGGYMIRNLGIRPNGSFGNVFLENLDPHDHANQYPAFGQPDLSEVTTGPSFDLHNLNAIPQKFNRYNVMPDPGSGASYRVGHFRDRSHLDLFSVDWRRIYWADDNGDYDSTRYTNLKLSVLGDRGFGGDYTVTPYITHLTSDTVDDILLGSYTVWHDEAKDSVIIALYRGGAKLASDTEAYEDTSAVVTGLIPPAGPAWETRITTQGDYRGVGRDDMITMDHFANLWYYRNDSPFDIGALARALTEDTLLVKWQNPSWIQYGRDDQTKTPFLSMRAMPKAFGDRSVDFMPVLATNDDRDSGIFIFRGGPDFGSHRLFLDSADFVIRNPNRIHEAVGGDDVWPFGKPVDAGDMTGTGNRVLYVPSRYAANFYVTGKALDEKIDMYENSAPGGLGDTLTSNDDSLEDFITSLPGYESYNDLLNGLGALGTVWIYKGSENIPVHLNPKWASVKGILQMDDAGISFYPNPATQGWSVATIVWPAEEIADYGVYNLLGEVVQSGTIHMFGGAEQQRLNFQNLATGVYEILVHGTSHDARAKLVIVQ